MASNNLNLFLRQRGAEAMDDASQCEYEKIGLIKTDCLMLTLKN